MHMCNSTCILAVLSKGMSTTIFIGNQNETEKKNLYFPFSLDLAETEKPTPPPPQHENNGHLKLKTPAENARDSSTK